MLFILNSSFYRNKFEHNRLFLVVTLIDSRIPCYFFNFSGAKQATCPQSESNNRDENQLNSSSKRNAVRAEKAISIVGVSKSA